MNLDDNDLHLDYQIVQEEPFETIHHRAERRNNFLKENLSLSKRIRGTLYILKVVQGGQGGFQNEEDFVNEKQGAQAQK